MILYMIRHGETDWNKEKRIQGFTDIPINENGRNLARKTAEGMKDIPIHRIYTSPLSRAMETADIVRNGREIPVIVTDAVKEFCFGSYEGMCVLEGEGKILNRTFFKNTAEFVPAPDGESLEQLLERTGAFLQGLYEDPKLQEETILISTHGAALTALINNVKGQFEISRFWEMGIPKNCSVSMVEVKDGIPKLIYENRVFE